MIHSKEDYISTLKVITGNSPDFLLLDMGNGPGIVESGKPPEYFFPGQPEELFQYFGTDHLRTLKDLSERGEGIAVFGRSSFLCLRKDFELIIFNSFLKGFASVIFYRNFTGNIPAEKSSGKCDEVSEMFRQIAENTNEMFWLRDEKEILYLNDQFEKIFGRSKKEVLNDPLKIREWIHPDDADRYEPWVDIKKIIKDTPFTEQFRITRPDGQVRWIWSRLFPVCDENGNIYRLAGIASDYSEQKDFEETLRIAKEKAQESDLLKSSFLANISHEIRTPMNGIIGFAELISREDIDSATRKHYLSIMRKSSDQLICIIDDLIDFAKLESNQIRILEEIVDLNRLISDLAIFYDNQLKSKEKKDVSLYWVTPLEGRDAVIISDENRLRQTLSYLIDNAIKFTSRGFIKFGYNVIDKKVRFFVQDTGIGIPESKFGHIFERFRQVDEGHTRKFGGTGLGLPLAKGLVNLLGGQIWPESELNKGSVFYFTVPYRTEQAESGEGNIKEDIVTHYRWKEKLILVAEDDELNYEYIHVLLEPTEAKLFRAKDGNQVIKICSETSFDLILMDIRLPFLNGIQATRQLRQMGVTTPIIAQTAFAMNDDEDKCLDAGCNRYISKPINKEKLFSLMNELL